jgi:hypothetical protein
MVIGHCTPLWWWQKWHQLNHSTLHFWNDFMWSLFLVCPSRACLLGYAYDWVLSVRAVGCSQTDIENVLQIVYNFFVSLWRESSCMFFSNYFGHHDIYSRLSSLSWWSESSHHGKDIHGWHCMIALFCVMWCVAWYCLPLFSCKGDLLACFHALLIAFHVLGWMEWWSGVLLHCCE